MSWRIIIEIEWPEQGTDFEGLLREIVDPLHRENVTVLGVSLEQVPEP